MRSGTLGAMLLIGTMGLGCGQPGSGPASAPDNRTAGSSKLAWASDWDDAFARAKRDNRVVMVEFYADWCVWCQRMESTTFTNPDVVGLLSDRAVPVKIDGEREGRVLAGKYRVDGYPTIIFLSADERELGRVPGYLEAADFVQAIRGWLGEAPDLNRLGESAQSSSSSSVMRPSATATASGVGIGSPVRGV